MEDIGDIEVGGQFDVSDSDHGNIMEKMSVKIFFRVLYPTIAVLSVVGNALVCLVLTRSETTWTPTKLFVANLASTNIPFCVFAVSPQLFFVGREMCHLAIVVFQSSVYVCTLTLTSAVVCRLIAVSRPFGERGMRLASGVAIAVIWVFAILASLPHGVFVSFKSVRYGYATAELCVKDWPTMTSDFIFQIVTLASQFVVPFIVIARCSNRMRNASSAKPARPDLEADFNLCSNRMLFTMVAVCWISWLPINLASLVVDIEIFADVWRISSWPYINVCTRLFDAVAISATCSIPFACTWFSESVVSEEFKRIFHRCFRRNRSPLSSSKVFMYETVDPTPARAESDHFAVDSEGPKAAACIAPTVQETVLSAESDSLH